MAHDEQLAGSNEAQLFAALTAGIEAEIQSSAVSGLMLDAGKQLFRLSQLRENSIDSWFDYHRTYYDGDHMEVVLVDRFNPIDGEKQTRVITKSVEGHKLGNKITVTDNFLAPLSSGFLHEKGTLLLTENMKKWPIGNYGRPVLRRQNNWVHIVSGTVYEHYPVIPELTQAQNEPLMKFSWLLGLLEDLDADTRQIGYRPGLGEF